jgi:C_GCAxxG_C_C family probable redox protein
MIGSSVEEPMSSENTELLEQIYRTGFDYEKNYGFCSQAVLATLHDYFDVVDAPLVKSSQTLAAGGGICGDGTCGALAGGMLALGAAFGRERGEFGTESGDRRRAVRIACKLRERFKAEFGSVICSDVQTAKMGRSFNLWDPEDYEKFEAAGAHRDKCPDVTGKTARWTAEVLIEEGVRPKRG